MEVNDWRVDLKNKFYFAFPEGKRVEPSENEELESLVSWMNGRQELLEQFSAMVNNKKYRFQHLQESVYAIRVIPSEILDANALGHRPGIVTEMLSRDHCSGGIILISGPMGSGKSTTASSVFRERLRRFGGYGLTIEDPIEYHLAGEQGPGYCNQIEAVGTEDYQRQIVKAKRAFPTKAPGILYLGEIRDSYTAQAAAQMAVSGVLVISTIHSFNLISAIQNYMDLMDAENSAIARYTLASSLKLVVCQHWGKQGGGIRSEMLPSSATFIGAIKNGMLDQLKNEINQVETRLGQGNK